MFIDSVRFTTFFLVILVEQFRILGKGADEIVPRYPDFILSVCPWIDVDVMDALNPTSFFLGGFSKDNPISNRLIRYAKTACAFFC